MQKACDVSVWLAFSVYINLTCALLELRHRFDVHTVNTYFIYRFLYFSISVLSYLCHLLHRLGFFGNEPRLCSKYAYFL